VIVAHGVARSRLVREGSYYYDRRRIFWPDGRPVYDAMLEASHSAKEWAVRTVPEYETRIYVAGDLRVDELLEYERGRGDIRDSLGWADRCVIAVMSTWGPHALIPTFGLELLPALARLVEEGRHAVVVTMHPNLWDKRRSGTDRWQKLVEAHRGRHFRVLSAEEDWAPWLAISDLAITDHTSLAAAYGVLNKPLIPVDVPLSIVGSETFASWLLNEHPHLTTAADLRSFLETAESGRTNDARPKPVDHLGEARARTRLIVLRVLAARDPSSGHGDTVTAVPLPRTPISPRL
jgi:hypothetical protein